MQIDYWGVAFVISNFAKFCYWNLLSSVVSVDLSILEEHFCWWAYYLNQLISMHLYCRSFSNLFISRNSQSARNEQAKPSMVNGLQTDSKFYLIYKNIFCVKLVFELYFNQYMRTPWIVNVWNCTVFLLNTDVKNAPQVMKAWSQSICNGLFCVIDRSRDQIKNPSKKWNKH